MGREGLREKVEGRGDRHPKILPSKSPDFLGLGRYIASAYVKLLENSFTLIFN